MKEKLKSLKKKAKGNYLALANIALSLTTLAYVLLINAKVNALGSLLFNIGMVLMVRLQEAQDQFGAAIGSILSLFGGDGA